MQIPIWEIEIPVEVSHKIRSKHKLDPKVCKEVLFERYSSAYVRKVKGSQYMAIGMSSEGFVTVFFTYKSNTATVRSVYRSSGWQINLYKGKRK